MRFPKLPVLLATATALIFTSCASSLERRISEFPEAWSKLPPRHQELARNRKIEEGMGHDAVFFSWGSPHRVTKGQKQGIGKESWRYLAYDPVFRQTVGFGHRHRRRFGYGHGYGYGYYPGGGYGGFGGYGSSVYYVPHEVARVDFRNGRVSAWQQDY